VARTGYGPDEEIVVFRAGPTRFRPDVLRAHAHADALSVLLRSGGEDVLRDAGTYLYSEGDGWRALLRGTASHSTVRLDGRDQAEVSSMRFGIAGLGPSRWLSFDGDAGRLLAAAEHPAAATTRVRRRLAWLRGGTLVLCDEVEGPCRTLEAWFQLPAAEGEPEGLSLLLTLASGVRLRLEALAGARRLSLHRPRGSRPEPGWYAPRYGLLERAVAVAVEAEPGPGPVRLLTALQVLPPTGEARDAADGAPRLRAQAGRELEVALPQGTLVFPPGISIRWESGGSVRSD
jgi:Heparinase II/III-like protein